MVEYIKREDAIRAVTPQYAPAINYALINMIQQVPAADVAPVRRGRWIMIDGMPHCDKCGLLPEHPTRYCPNCGAKMDGGEA